ncbi:phage tail protein, partial [Leuconostoc mesenteroides subsp. mesenteroides]
MLKYKPSDFNKKAQFGTIKPGYNPKNGNPIKQFVPQIGLKYA